MSGLGGAIGDAVAGARRFASEKATLIRFASVGAISTSIDFALFVFLVEAVGLPIYAANVTSYLTSLLASFALNQIWTFGGAIRNAEAGRRLARYAAVHAASVVLSTAIVRAFAIFAPAPVAKALSVPIVFIWNYTASRRWVFRERNSASDAASSAV